MLDAHQYASGADVEVYLSDTPPRAGDTPLDVRGVTIVQEGDVLPLYEFAEHLAKHFAYATKLVTGALEFNFSGASGARAVIQEKTLWFVLTRTEWWPETLIYRDIFRCTHVWEHPVQHEPASAVGEVVPFSARSLALYSRQRAVINPEAIILSDETDSYTMLGDQPFRYNKIMYQAKVIGVTDGDTLNVQLLEPPGPGVEDTMVIRLIAADTPEKTNMYGGSSNNHNDETPYKWPDNAPAKNPVTDGAPNASPTDVQLDAWGNYARVRVVKLLDPDATIAAHPTYGADLGDITWSNGNTPPLVWLVADPGVAPTDNPEFDPFLSTTSANPNSASGERRYGRRYLFQIEVGSQDLSEYLIKEGLCIPYYTLSVQLAEDPGLTKTGHSYVSRMALLERYYKQARAKAGTNDAKGVWSTFDAAAYRAANPGLE